MGRQHRALTRSRSGKGSGQTPAIAPGRLDLKLETESGEGLPVLPAPPDKLEGGSRKVRAQLVPAPLPAEETVLIDPPVEARKAGGQDASQ